MHIGLSVGFGVNLNTWLPPGFAMLAITEVPAPDQAADVSLFHAVNH